MSASQVHANGRTSLDSPFSADPPRSRDPHLLSQPSLGRQEPTLTLSSACANAAAGHASAPSKAAQQGGKAFSAAAKKDPALL